MHTVLLSIIALLIGTPPLGSTHRCSSYNWKCDTKAELFVSTSIKVFPAMGHFHSLPMFNVLCKSFNINISTFLLLYRVPTQISKVNFMTFCRTKLRFSMTIFYEHGVQSIVWSTMSKVTLSLTINLNFFEK